MMARATEEILAFYERVTGLCVERLKEALNPRTHLFDRQIRNRRWEETFGTEELTSTAICLIGLHRAAIEPVHVGLDVSRTLSALAEASRRRSYIGGLGLVLWANSVWHGVPAAQLLGHVGISLANPKELVTKLTTMELAWLVSGLIHVRRNSVDGLANALEIAQAELFGRFDPSTLLFCHASDAAPIMHRVRKRISNFADQIYSTQAMAFLSVVDKNEAALDVSGGCARRLVELQGPLGQWWWHYDSRGGTVLQGFPVYSVHQHAMAPMALMTLAAAGGTSYLSALESSYAWLDNNEIGSGMVDRTAGTIWRDIEIEESQLGRISRHARSLLGWTSSDGGTTVANFKVNHETRPYEWAWCLFAGAIATAADRSEHIV